MLRPHRRPDGVLFNLRTFPSMVLRPRSALLQQGYAELVNLSWSQAPFLHRLRALVESTVESVCKEVFRVMHALNSETRTPEADWPTTVQAASSTTRLLVDWVDALPSPFTLECRQESLSPSRF